MLTIPFVVFLGVLFSLQQAGAAEADREQAGVLFILNMAYLAMGVPLGFWFRTRQFERYYHGEPVDPRRYLLGINVLWLVLMVGGLLSLLSVWVSRSITPNIVPAIVAFIFFVSQWPKGHAMLRPRGDRDDPEIYEEPR